MLVVVGNELEPHRDQGRECLEVLRVPGLGLVKWS